MLVISGETMSYMPLQLLKQPPAPSLYAQYIAERQGKYIIENDKGFATYFFVASGIYAEDVYIRPEFRRTKAASQFGDQIAQIGRTKGFNKMYGSVKPSTNGATDSLKFLLSYGFKLLESASDAIILVKEI